jgi:hypothetical protein
MPDVCDHEFVMEHGMCCNGAISLHGRCLLCDVSMSVQGYMDSDGNGSVEALDINGDFRKKFIVQDREIKYA